MIVNISFQTSNDNFPTLTDLVNYIQARMKTKVQYNYFITRELERPKSVVDSVVPVIIPMQPSSEVEGSAPYEVPGENNTVVHLNRKDFLQWCVAIIKKHTETDNITELWQILNKYGAKNEQLIAALHLDQDAYDSIMSGVIYPYVRRPWDAFFGRSKIQAEEDAAREEQEVKKLFSGPATKSYMIRKQPVATKKVIDNSNHNTTLVRAFFGNRNIHKHEEKYVELIQLNMKKQATSLKEAIATIMDMGVPANALMLLSGLSVVSFEKARNEELHPLSPEFSDLCKCFYISQDGSFYRYSISYDTDDATSKIKLDAYLHDHCESWDQKLSSLGTLSKCSHFNFREHEWFKDYVNQKLLEYVNDTQEESVVKFLRYVIKTCDIPIDLIALTCGTHRSSLTRYLLKDGAEEYSSSILDNVARTYGIKQAVDPKARTYTEDASDIAALPLDKQAKILWRRGTKGVKHLANKAELRSNWMKQAFEGKEFTSHEKFISYVKRLNIPQSAIVEISGSTAVTVSHWLNPRLSPSLIMKLRLERVLKCKFNYIGEENSNGTTYESIPGNTLKQKSECLWRTGRQKRDDAPRLKLLKESVIRHAFTNKTFENLDTLLLFCKENHIPISPIANMISISACYVPKSTDTGRKVTRFIQAMKKTFNCTIKQ